MQGNVPHVACNVWLRGNVCTFIYGLEQQLSAEPHVASNVRYIACPLRTNSVLTPCRARCGTFTLLPFSKRAFPFFSPRKSAPTARWALAHRPVGARPSARGRWEIWKLKRECLILRWDVWASDGKLLAKKRGCAQKLSAASLAEVGLPSCGAEWVRPRQGASRH